MYNWQDYDHFIALLDQAHQVYDQLLHPFHAAAYPVSGERFKDLAVSYASHTLALVHPKFRLSHRDQSNETGTGRIRCVLRAKALVRCLTVYTLHAASVTSPRTSGTTPHGCEQLTDGRAFRPELTS